MTHDEGIALVRAQQAGEHRDGGGLPGPVRTEQAEDLTLAGLRKLTPSTAFGSPKALCKFLTSIAYGIAHIELLYLIA